MTEQRISATALIAGSLGSLLTMALHPSGGGALTLAQARRLALMSGIAHSIAIVSLIVFLLGALGLTRHLSRQIQPVYLPLAGFVSFAFATVAILIAAAVSGFIVPALFLRMLQDDPAYMPHWRIVISAVFQFNQSFSAIYTVASSAAILLWSISALRHGGLGRGLAIYGCIGATLLTVLIAAGHLRLNVHGMAAVVVVHAIWIVLAGVQMARAA